MSQEKDNRRGRKWAILRLGLFIMVALVALIGANIWKRDLRVGMVRIEGNSIVQTDDIRTRAAVPLGVRLFDVDLAAVEKRVKQNAFIRTVRINREIPDLIMITVEERTPLAAIVSGTLKYIDQEGVVLPPVRSERMIDLPLFTGVKPKKELVPGATITDSVLDEMLTIVRTSRLVNDDLFRNISEIHSTDDGLILFTSDCGTPVVFGRGDVARKLVTMDGFWKHVVQPVGAQMVEYLDVRFDDEVICRWRKEAATAVEEADNQRFSSHS
jgi:cell division protein FtsQ